MVSGTIAFLAGILCLQQFTTLPSTSWCWLLLVCLPGVVRFYRGSYSLHPLFLLCCFVTGFTWSSYAAHQVLDISLPSNYEGKDLNITGIVSSVPVVNSKKIRFEFDILTARYQGRLIHFPAKVRLNWYNPAHNDRPEAGQKWQFWVRLKQPHGFMNPGGFDYEGWLFRKKIRATGYVRIKKNKSAQLLSRNISGYFIQSVRQALFDQFKQITKEYEYKGFITALAFGERSLITKQQWQVLRKTGTSHLVAISGLHVGLFSGFIYFLSRFFWGLSFRFNSLLAAPRFAAIVSIAAACFYATLSGFAVPAQRALVMVCVVMVSLFYMRRIKPVNLITLALLFVLIYDPLSVLSPGFWLSFLAVSIIILASTGRLKLNNKGLYLWTSIQFRISLVLLPVLVFLFQQASVVSPLTNMIAIPVVSLVIVPIVLIATSIILLFGELFLALPTILFGVVDVIFDYLWLVLSLSADLKYSAWDRGKPGLVVILLAMAGFSLFLAPTATRFRLAGLFLVLPLFMDEKPVLSDGEAEITLLDVGQGHAAVVRTRSHALVFDTGPSFGSNFDTGAAVIIPFLRQTGINYLDKIIVSHADNDHRGGFKSLSQAIEFKDYITGFNSFNSRLCQAGDYWYWNNVEFRFLNRLESKNNHSRNNNSCVLRVTAGDESVLFSADIESETEQGLVKRYGDELKSQYLVVPHHGSKTSSSEAFITKVSPDYALIPVGYRSRYRQPHSEIVSKYRKRGSHVLMTYQTGAIRFTLGQLSNKKTVFEYRQVHQKYWNSRH